MLTRTWPLAIALVALLAAPAGAAFPCIGCPRPIAVGSYLIYDVDGTKYYSHPDHPKAGVCQGCAGLLAPRSPWGPGGVEADGLAFCNRCLPTIVRSAPRAQRLVDGVRRQMESWGMRFAWGKIPVLLVDQAALDGKYASRHPGSRTSGLTDSQSRIWNDGRRELVSLRILMRNTLPEAEFQRTAAHELTHAWMSMQNAPEGADRAFVEGACNLVAYYYLQTQPGAAATRLRKKLLASDDPVYGEGLRRQIKYATDHRVRGLLKILPSATGFPAGY